MKPHRCVFCGLVYLIDVGVRQPARRFTCTVVHSKGNTQVCGGRLQPIQVDVLPLIYKDE